MSLYEFHFIGLAGDRPALDFSQCADDGEAAREGLNQLGQHDSAVGVEVWDGDRLVIRIERSPAQVRAVGSPRPAANGLRDRSASPGFWPPLTRPQR